MVEVIKIGNKTLIMDGKILSLFRKGSLLRQMWYGGYEDFDGANGGVWKKYINIPITTIPSEYAQYIIEIDDTNVSVYNVEGTLKAQSSIASEFWSLVRSDGFDIRVFDHLFNQLWFWVEEFDYANKKAKVWVRLPKDSEELNIAFGNEKASESSYNNGDETFEFFDDFEGTELDTTKWSFVEGSSVQVANSEVTLSGSTTSISTRLYKTFPINTIAFYKAKMSGDGATYFGFSDYDGSTINGSILVHLTYGFSVRKGSNYTKLTRNTGVGVYHVWEIRRIGNDTVEFYADGSYDNGITSTTYVPDHDLPLFMRNYSGDTLVCDWVFVTKLSDPASFDTPRIIEF